MVSPLDLQSLRLALLLQPGHPQHWQQLIDLIKALGGGLLLADLNELFDEPLQTAVVPSAAQHELLLQEGLEAHRSQDVHGLSEAVVAMQALDPDGAWTHALQGLLAEMEGRCAYAAFTRALERDGSNPWFRYWLSVAALRRRDWLDFSYQALLLADSDVLQHQAVVFAAVHQLIASSLATLMPEPCQNNDLRMLDFAHPDMIAHDWQELEVHVLRLINKERRKMLRIMLAYLIQNVSCSAEHGHALHGLHSLLKWRVINLAEPELSLSLYLVLQRRFREVPDRSQYPEDLFTLLPSRPDRSFTEHHIQVWREFRLTLQQEP